MLKRRLLNICETYETLIITNNITGYVTVTGGGVTYLAQTCNANIPYPVQIPDGVTYTISNSAVTNYNTPGNVSYTAVGKSTRNVTRSYTIKKERVYIKVTGTNATVTITYNGATRWTQNCVDGTQYYHDINYGTSYTVTFSNVSGYITPNSISYTANTTSRTITGVYSEPEGAWIELIDGTFVSKDNFNSSTMVANSVVYGAEGRHIKIALSDVASKQKYASEYVKYDNVYSTSYNLIAELDYNGKSNSIALLNYRRTNAAHAAANYTLPNGQKGRLPSGGEFAMFYKYNAVINECISIAGGTQIRVTTSFDVSYWTSTQEDDSWAHYWGKAWVPGVNGSSSNQGSYGISCGDKNTLRYVRPFADYE